MHFQCKALADTHNVKIKKTLYHEGHEGHEGHEEHEG